MTMNHTSSSSSAGAKAAEDSRSGDPADVPMMTDGCFAAHSGQSATNRVDGHGGEALAAVEALLDELSCPICTGRLEDALMCSFCSKAACSRCWDDWVEGHSTCMFCRHDFPQVEHWHAPVLGASARQRRSGSLLKFSLADDILRRVSTVASLIECGGGPHRGGVSDGSSSGLSASAAAMAAATMPEPCGKSGLLMTASTQSRTARACPVHAHMDTNVFCSDCRQVVCHACALFGEHKGHSCQPRAEAVHAARAELDELQESLIRMVSRLRVAKSDVAAAAARVDDDKALVLKRLERRVAELASAGENATMAAHAASLAEAEENADAVCYRVITVKESLACAARHDDTSDDSDVLTSSAPRIAEEAKLVLSAATHSLEKALGDMNQRSVGEGGVVGAQFGTYESVMAHFLPPWEEVEVRVTRTQLCKSHDAPYKSSVLKTRGSIGWRLKVSNERNRVIRQRTCSEHALAFQLITD